MNTNAGGASPPSAHGPAVGSSSSGAPPQANAGSAATQAARTGERPPSADLVNQCPDRMRFRRMLDPCLRRSALQAYSSLPGPSARQATVPPMIVITGLAPPISASGTSSMFLDNTVMSASLPTSSDPRFASSCAP